MKARSERFVQIEGVVWYKGEPNNRREWRGIHLLTGDVNGRAALELLQAPPPYQGEEILVDPARISRKLTPTNFDLAQQLLTQRGRDE